jgi:hypothetical protein
MIGQQNGLMMGQPAKPGGQFPSNYLPLNLPPVVFGLPAMNSGSRQQLVRNSMDANQMNAIHSQCKLIDEEEDEH